MGVVYNHATWEEFVEQALHAKLPKGSKCQKNGRTSRDGKDSFYGATWAEAVNLFEIGWEEGREFINKIVTDIENSQSEIFKQRVEWDVQGDAVDVGRFVSGEPECMMKWSKRKTKMRRARILANISVSAGINHTQIRWKGACTLALIDRLESAGIRVELDLGICYRERGYSGGEDEIWAETINVKRSDEPLQIDRLAFLLAHPASFRRIMFSYEEASPLRTGSGELVANEHCCYGDNYYGTPVTNMAPYVPESDSYDLIVPGIQLADLNSAIAQMEKMFNQIVSKEV